MGKTSRNSAIALAGLVICLIVSSAIAETFNIPSGTLAAALDAYSAQSGVPVAIATQSLGNARSKGVSGEMSADQALSQILSGTGFAIHRVGSSIAIVRAASQHGENIRDETGGIQLAAAQAAPASLETVTVTSSKIGGDVQNIPISITALSQEQLTATQTTGGPDLVKQVPNLTFTKTNFTGYSITIRGIGTQAISVSTDPAVAVALNDIPFIRNHFFEQEFYDLSQAEVLRGPQGTLYGRNATAGVVNLITAKPTDQFEAMASLEIGNYGERRPEGMINIPIVDDRVDLRIAGEWTKRQGYSFDQLTDDRIDGRDLWSGRVTLGFNPTQKLKTTLVWEHFSESDDRMRTSKQLCKTDPRNDGSEGDVFSGDYSSQGCLPTSLYSPDAFEVPNGFALPYYAGIAEILSPFIRGDFDPYASTTQSQNLRVIESSINPIYKAKNDTLEFNADYAINPTLTFTSQTGYNHDFLWSTEDYNRFNTAPGIFGVANGQVGAPGTAVHANPNGLGFCASSGGSCQGLAPGAACKVSSSTDPNCSPDGIFCDPQLGCSDRLVAQDLSDEHAWQLSQEFRLASNFSGPLNFSIGGNYLHYETEENYYVFINTLSLLALHNNEYTTYVPGVTDNSECLQGGYKYPSQIVSGQVLGPCFYMDPNPLTKLNNEGHNYFLSQNPYVLNSYAGFGEVYYNVVSDLKLISGVRWTEDRKHFVDIPSELIIGGFGYPISGIVNQQWDQLTGRAAVNWTPKLDFTDQTLVYGSYAHGYKAGGANPPGAVFPFVTQAGVYQVTNPLHPLTFKPEFIDAFEFGSKNTLLDGALTLNGDIFYYNYENYQISRIVDRTAINDNFNAHVKGAEIESTYEPLPGLRLNFAGGWEDAVLAKGDHSVDLIDRTAGTPGWVVIKPFVSEASNCVLPTYIAGSGDVIGPSTIYLFCNLAYSAHLDPQTQAPYAPGDDCGFDPLAGTPGDPYHGQNTCDGVDYGPAPNNGQGFDKNLGGNKLPNAPPFTMSFGAQYTMPLSTDWAGTLRGDYYWQDYSWARVFNDNPYDRLRGYTNVNLTLIFTNQNGWQVMLYDKNVFDTTAITGDFLNSDDSGLTTNVFLTDPKLIGIRVTKNW